MKPITKAFKLALIGAASTLAPVSAWANSPCGGLPSHAELKAALEAATGNPPSGNGGFNLEMWGTIVNRDGVVCAVAFTGAGRGDQWPGSRVISGQKANTANAFSLNGLALSTANLYSAVSPGGSLYGLQHSNPVDTAVAYGGPGHVGGSASNYGKPTDPLVGKFIGGVNVFGGGLALYNGSVIGGLGVSGDSSCADHNVAWKTRFFLNLDNVPGGVSPTGDDNIVNDITPQPGQQEGVSAGGFGHPACSPDATTIAADLPADFPIGPSPPAP